MKIKIIVISAIIFSCSYLLYSHYEHKQYLKSSLQNFNKKKNEKIEKERQLRFIENVKKNSIKDSKESKNEMRNKDYTWGGGLSYKENVKRLENSTTDQKACVETLGNGKYARESLSFKLDMCNVPYKKEYD